MVDFVGWYSLMLRFKECYFKIKCVPLTLFDVALMSAVITNGLSPLYPGFDEIGLLQFSHTLTGCLLINSI